MNKVYLFSLLLLISCSTQVIEPQNNSSLEKIIKVFDESENQSTDSVKPDTKASVEEISFQVADPQLDEKVKFWIDYFAMKDRKRFQRFLNRGQIYKEVVETILEEHGLPSDLYYLAMIESGYVSAAKSHAQAVGVWQFVRGTGKRYGLEVNPYVDERKDPVRSTEAAAKYLRDLFNAFNSWELAMASYNCGEFRVLQSIMKGDTRNFWDLDKKKLLPKETRNYIPKFIAATIIGKNPEKYGFEIPNEDVEKYPDIVSVEVPSPIKLVDVAKEIGVSLDSLKTTNPHLIRGITPPIYSTYEIWIPRKSEEKFKTVAANLNKYKVKTRIRPTETGLSKHYYVVKRGDTLSDIAAKFRESTRHLAKINNLKRNRIYAGQRLRLTTRNYKSVGKNSKYYFVRKGDNLGKIARKFNLGLSRLKRLNGIRGSKIYVGQKLNVNRSPASVGKYKVRRGDNLSRIASSFGLSIRKLKSLNNLRSSKIFIGQVLKVN